jgi:outer membrane protein
MNKVKRKVIFFCCILLLGISNIYSQQLTLDSCRNMALRHNKGSQISEETLLAAQENRKAAFTQFLPNFNAVGTYTYNSKNISMLGSDALLPVGSINTSTGGFTYNYDATNANNCDMVTTTLANGAVVPINAQGQPTSNPNEFIPKHVAYLPKSALSYDIENVFTAGIGFTQPIFMGGKILELYRMSQTAERMAQITQNNNDINILIQVDEAYWRVVSIQKKYELAKEYNNLLKTTYNNVNEMFKEGVVTNADLLKVKVKLNESEMTLTKAENGLKLSKMNLNQICGMPFGTDYTLADIDKVDELNLQLGDSVKTSIASRPETQLLEENVNLAKSEVNLARSRFMPNIVATGNYFLSNPNIYNGFDKSFKGMFTFGVGVTVPIFHFGERLHTLSAAKHQLRIAELTRDESVEKMELQANMQQNKKTESLKQDVIATNNMAQAEENLRQAQLGFKEGVLSTSDLMEAQTSWVSAKSDVIDAKINMALSNLYLQQSLGKIQVPNIDRNENNNKTTKTTNNNKTKK